MIDATDIVPEGVELRDPEDFNSLRRGIFDNVKNEMTRVFPQEFGGVKLALKDVDYDGPEDSTLEQQRKAIMQGEYLARRLRGTMELYDTKSGELLDQKRMTLARVPYLTQRGTYIHNGSEYAPINQARLLPGAYTRIQNNGGLESQFNVRPGSGSRFRVAFEPETAQYRFRVKESDLHLYSLLREIGVGDDELEKSWGSDILEINRKKFDPRVVDKAYLKFVPRRLQLPNADHAQKRQAITSALQATQVHRGVLQANLPDGLDDDTVKQSSTRPVDMGGTANYLGGDSDHVHLGLKAVMASTRKLLNINRQIEKPDDSNALRFQRFLTPDRLMAERLTLDATNNRRNLVRMASRHRNLSGVMPFIFSKDIESAFVSNPLAAPLEEINPMSLVGQNRRITRMGPGGIGSSEAVTEDMQAVHASQFGFLSPIEGPESHSHDTEVFTKRGWVPWPEVTDSEMFACRVDDRLEFHHASHVNRYPFVGGLIGVRSQDFSFLVTPNHRLLYTPYEASSSKDPVKAATQNKARVAFAEELYGKNIKFPCDHLPTLGREALHDYPDNAVDTADFCEFLAWWLAEGHVSSNVVTITKTKHYRPVDNAHLSVWLPSVGFDGTWRVRKGTSGDEGFYISSDSLAGYVKQFGKSGTKFIPEWVFDTDVATRQRMLDVFMRTDSRVNKTHRCYVSTSKRLAQDVQRLMISLGYPTNFREEPDNREHVKSTNWVACLLKTKSRIARANTKYDYWIKEHYDGLVYCATVPGGFLFTRRGRGVGFWSGNSEAAGIDNRLAYGVRIGSDGRPYQRFRNTRTNQFEWMSPESLAGKVVAFPP